MRNDIVESWSISCVDGGFLFKWLSRMLVIGG